jgi:alpha-1,2-mannosyltransferase
LVGQGLTEAIPTYLLVLGQVAAVVCGVVAIQAWLQTGRPAPLHRAAVAAGCVVLAILTFAMVDPQYPFWDYRIAYYPAGGAVLHDPASLAALMGQGVNGFVNLPIVAYVFAPFSMLSLRYAIGLFTLIGFAMTVVAWVLLASLAGLKGAERWLLLLLFVANGPLQYSLKEGNTSHWVLAALAGGLYLLRAGRPAAAGALLGAAAVLKLPLLLFGAYFALRRNWRGTIGFAAVCGAMGLLSVILFGWDFHVRWFDLCVRQFSSHWIAAFNVQSIQSFVLRLHPAPERLRDWTAYLPGAGQRIAGYILIGLLYLLALWCAIVRGRRMGEAGRAATTRTDLEFLLVLCLALVSSPLSWSHYYTWLLLPAAFHLGSASPFAPGSTARWLRWLAIILAMVLVRPVQFDDPTLMIAYSMFGASCLLFGGLLWIGSIAWSLAQSGMAVPPALPASDRALPARAETQSTVLAARHSAGRQWTAPQRGRLS